MTGWARETAFLNICCRRAPSAMLEADSEFDVSFASEVAAIAVVPVADADVDARGELPAGVVDSVMPFPSGAWAGPRRVPQPSPTCASPRSG